MEKRKVQKILLNWFGKAARDLPWRRTSDPYAIWVSEIMLQQTRVTTVLPYYERFLAALPTVADLASADEDVLHRLWKGLGYYRRAALLRKGAQYVMQNHGGTLPADAAALSAIPGFGPYTAGAVGSIAFSLPVAAVDGNVVRVFSRWLNDDTPADALRVRLQAGEAEAWVAREAPGAWSQALMELGATVCTPRKPLCAACPVHDHCAAARAGTVADRPVKGKAGKHTVLPVHVAVYRQGGAVWLEKRPTGGLLAGLWGFPMPSKRPGLRSKEVLRYKHVFTHRTWEAKVFQVSGKPPKDSKGKWVALGDLAHEAIPTAFQPVVRYLTEPRLL